jgi:hypothetical protein
LNQILKRQTSRFHYGSKVPAVTITVFTTILENKTFQIELVFHCRTFNDFSDCDDVGTIQYDVMEYDDVGTMQYDFME